MWGRYSNNHINIKLILFYINYPYMLIKNTISRKKSVDM